MMARTIKKITSLTRIKIEKDTRDNNDSLLKTSLEEVKSVRDSSWKTFKIKPEVEGGVRDVLDVETHPSETLNHIVSLVLEVTLEGFHFCEDLAGFEHRDGGFLEGDVGSTVKVGTTGSDGFDEFL
jgi:hypothetical protein